MRLPAEGGLTSSPATVCAVNRVGLAMTKKIWCDNGRTCGRRRAGDG
jgi:hypothetical protein